MKKVLTLIGSISIVGSGASTVISCSNSVKFNPYDFSTWSSKKKEISFLILRNIKDSYPRYIKSWSEWYGAVYETSLTAGDEQVLPPLQLFNKDINLDTYKGSVNTQYTMWDILNKQITADYTAESYAQTFKNGVIFKIIAVPNYEIQFKGELDVLIKGDIT